MPGPLITRRDIATRAVVPQRRRFDKVTGAVREALVHFVWSTANRAVTMPHSLSRTPTQYRVVRISKDNSSGGTAPGSVYAPIVLDSASTSPTDTHFNFTKTHITLSCTTANTWAEIIVS